VVYVAIHTELTKQLERETMQIDSMLVFVGFSLSRRIYSMALLHEWCTSLSPARRQEHHLANSSLMSCLHNPNTTLGVIAVNVLFFSRSRQEVGEAR
jgi:hypothetical protein